MPHLSICLNAMLELLRKSQPFEKQLRSSAALDSTMYRFFGVSYFCRRIEDTIIRTLGLSLLPIIYSVVIDTGYATWMFAGNLLLLQKHNS